MVRRLETRSYLNLTFWAVAALIAVSATARLSAVDRLPQETTRHRSRERYIAKHPEIRARALHQQDYSAAEVAEVLRDEFGLGALETARILSDEEYEPVVIAKAMRDVLSVDAAQIAQILKELGYSSVEVGRALGDAFAQDAQGVARILKDAGFSAVRIGLVLKHVFDQDEWRVVKTLKNTGCSAKEAYDVLTLVYEVDDVILAEQILRANAYPPEEYLEFTARASVEQFAPVVKFDRDVWHLPMSAQRWFDQMLCGEQGGPPFQDGEYRYDQCADWDSDSHDYRFPNDREVWGNPPPYGRLPAGSSSAEALMDVEDFDDPELGPDWSWGTNGPQGGPNVPTYFKVMDNKETGALRIKYFRYYGYQFPCEWSMKYELGRLFTDRPVSNGEHVGDWEHVMITTSPDRSTIEAVSYFQHYGYYTRWSSVGGVETEFDGYALEAQRPVVYVGRFSHGSYFDSETRRYIPCFSLACGYFNDRRGPASRDDWWFTDANLVSLRGEGESWMAAESAPLPTGATERWVWGPPVNACSVCLLGICWKHREMTASGTHPTLVPPVGSNDKEDWCFASCKVDGCDKDQWALITDQEKSNWNAWCEDELYATTTNDGAEPCDTCGAFDLQALQANQEQITETFIKVVAATLGMSVEELTATVTGGQTFCQVVEARGLDLAEVWATTQNTRQIILRQAVEDELVIQAQADLIREMLAEPPKCADPIP